MDGTDGGRVCASCDHRSPADGYSTEQWDRGPGASSCKGCGAHAEVVATMEEGNALPAARENGDACRSVVDAGELWRPLARGTFRVVASGRYCDDRSGQNVQRCVSNWIKTGATVEDNYFSTDHKPVAAAIRIVGAFNKARVVRGLVRVNEPAVWVCADGRGPEWKGKQLLKERFIFNYPRFNSNTGWSDTSVRWGEIMQALSHFTYHASGGKEMLVDLQGGHLPG